MQKKSLRADVDLSVKDLDLGKKIRSLRRQAELTLKELALATGLSVPLLSQIENDIVIPPISTLLKISRALDTDISFFFLDLTPNKKITVVKRSERIRLSTKDMKRERTAYSYETLAHKKKKKKMEPFVVEIKKKSKKRMSLVKHKGEEFIFVLEGSIEFSAEGQSYTLHAGDCVYFESEVPHASRAIGETSAKAILVIFSP